MAVDFTEKSKRYQAIDEIIASGRKLKWNEIIAELKSKYDIKTSKTSFYRDIEELQEKYRKHMKYLFNEYAELVDNGINTFLIKSLIWTLASILFMFNFIIRFW